MDLPEHIRMDNATDNLTPNSISYSSARMTSRSSGPMKSLNFTPYSNSSKEWEYAARCLRTIGLQKSPDTFGRGGVILAAIKDRKGKIADLLVKVSRIRK
ncbi:hypothetical protein AVEN_117157-1 [Araneus ventricosus]|uniref:Uncharacterized protein n=1 Tax=Araneus ventricosus TaxID=182803 RepID=A0A4Y2AZC8_ARAVE|nr:hypothetical protein AVEN_117157-1 [Araneus ventricosus]